MSKQKFDSKTTKKLISTYKNTISHYTAENEMLTSQLQDLKTTLSLNQNLLYDFITKSIGEDDEITNLINESKNLWQENEQLIKQKNDLEMKASKLQELIEDTPTEIREEIKLINISNNKMKNELIQKDNTIKKLKSELEKARKNALFKTARTEILVTEPTKTNVEINHELLNTKAILAKVSNMHALEKKKAARLDKEVKALQDEVIALRRNTTLADNNNNDGVINTDGNKLDDKKNSKTISNTINGKNDKKNNLTQNQGKKNENEFEDSDENDEESEENSDDIENIETELKKKKKPKTKQKELDMLTEEFNKLKKQNEEYEKKIQKYKNIYKDMKQKIKNLNQMSKSQIKSERRHNLNNINLPASSTDDATSHKNI
jgi:chromosome segregation ATPase